MIYKQTSAFYPRGIVPTCFRFNIYIYIYLLNMWGILAWWNFEILRFKKRLILHEKTEVIINYDSHDEFDAKGDDNVLLIIWSKWILTQVI